jgi:ferric-dicitrate binding protein FerR (iron transport regulator)
VSRDVVELTALGYLEADEIELSDLVDAIERYQREVLDRRHPI